MCSIWVELFAFVGVVVLALIAVVLLAFATGVLRTEHVSVTRGRETKRK